jgi:glucokinase
VVSVEAGEAVRTVGVGRARAVLGLDIGGTKIAAGVVDADGGVHGFVTAPSDPDSASGVERLFELGRRSIAEAGLDVEAVGIGCGGPLDSEKGLLIAPLHLPGWKDVPVAELAATAFDRPAFLDNDGTAGAAGEHRFGAGRGAHAMVYLTISTGVGGGVVLDGVVQRGRSGNGGELGHVTVDWHGRPCRGCGRRGCLEAYVSGTSIAERAREAGLDVRSAEQVAAAAAVGEPVASEVWAGTVEALGCGLTSIVNLFEPELVVIGGGVSRAGELLLGPVRERVSAGAMGPAARAVEIVSAALGDQVGVVGAAAIVYDRAESRGRGS